MVTALAKVPKENGATKQASKRKSLSVLDQLKQTAYEKHKQVSRGLRMTLNAAREAGEALAKIKKQVGRGNWEDLFEGEHKVFEFSIVTARKYIKIFENWDLHKLEDKDITIERACKVISGYPIKTDWDDEETDLKKGNGKKKQKADDKPDEKEKAEDWLALPFDDEVVAYCENELPDGFALKDFIIVLLKEAIAARRAKS